MAGQFDRDFMVDQAAQFAGNELGQVVRIFPTVALQRASHTGAPGLGDMNKQELVAM